MSGWNAYSMLGINAGGSSAAIFGHNGAKWAGSDKSVADNGGIKVVRNFAQLLADVKGGANSSEMHFDGVKFMALGVQEGVAIGKKGDESVGCILTAQTLVIVIAAGPPQSAVAATLAVYNAVKAAGQ